MTTLTITQAVKQLIQGNVIAYPTEAVFGLGCDPDCEQAVLTILQIKQRPIEKGLILIAHSVEQLLPYIDITAITARQKKTLLNTWPGAVTWVVPKNRHTPYFLTGQFDSIAVRVTDHRLASQLCQLFGKPLVSTSANLSGLPPCRTRMEVEQQFGQVFPVLQGETGNNANPSTIRDSKTGQIIRQG